MIDEIAFQKDILVLNVVVEAACARGTQFEPRAESLNQAVNDMSGMLVQAALQQIAGRMPAYSPAALQIHYHGRFL